MASVRQITRKNRDGSSTKAWQLSYIDAAGKRHRKNFNLKRDADSERIRIESQLQTGTHVPDNTSRTVYQGCLAWIDHIDLLARAGKRSLVTWEKYRQHVECHIKPRPLSNILLSRLRPSDVAEFAEELERSLSGAMAKKVMADLRMALAYCRKHQWLATDPTEGVRIEASSLDDDEAVEIPPKADLKALLKATEKAAQPDGDDGGDHGRSKAMVHLLLYCGLRMGELRAVTRGALSLKGAHPFIQVAQAADQYQKLKAPKTRAGRRRIPLGPETVKALQAWLPHAPVSELHLVFPTGIGTVESHTNLRNRWWKPLMADAGLVTEDGKPHFSFHTLRHAAASLWIEMGLQPKRVQKLMGHASLQMTMDLYGHLWHDPAQDSQIARQMERQLG